MKPRETLDFAYPIDPIHTVLADNVAILRHIFDNCSDMVFQHVSLLSDCKLVLIYMNGVINTKEMVPKLFQAWVTGTRGASTKTEKTGTTVKQFFATLHSLETTTSFKALAEGILQGNLGVLIEGEHEALFLDVSGIEHRGVEEPAVESAIRGPRESFTETLSINTNLIRRKIQTPRLKSVSVIIGELTKTKIAVLYMEGIAKPQIITMVKERLSRIKIDAILESGYVEECIEDRPFSPFPQIQNTERPDIAAASLLEGKVVLVIDGTPNALILPMTFWMAFQSVEDYYERFLYATLIRWMRFVLFFLSMYLPSLFVAITTFHPQLLPANFLLSVITAREGVPFPSVVEALMMEFMFEALREAGIRLPKAVGSAVSIVGALVIGQAAVQAGFVSAPIVIIVSMTGIASFTIPRYNMGIAFRIIRFPLLFLSGSLGLYGIAMGTLFILIHMARLESFGLPFLSPIAPLRVHEIKDMLFRAPRVSMDRLLPLAKAVRKRGK